MTKVIGPLFSLDARGTLGDTLIYSKQSGTTYTKAYAVPSNPKTDDQMGIRIGTKAITQAWSLLTDEQKAAWEPLADQLHLSPYHAFLAFNCRRWAKHHMPSVVPEPSQTCYLDDAELYNEVEARTWTANLIGQTGPYAPFIVEFTWTIDPPGHDRKFCRVLQTDFSYISYSLDASATWTAPDSNYYYASTRINNIIGGTSEWVDEGA